MNNEDKIRNARWKLAEKIVQTDYEWDNIKIIRLMISKNGNELNAESIRNFLNDYEKKEEVISLLVEINKGYELPDFMIMDCANKLWFVEVKSMKGKVKLSQIDNGEAIKLLATAGYSCIIKNIRIENISESEIETTLNEYGDIMKGKAKGEPLYYLRFLEEKIQSLPYENVKIIDMTISLNKP